MPLLIPLDAPLALLLAIGLGALAFRLSGAVHGNGSRRAYRWWDAPLLGIPLALTLLEGAAPLIGMGLILGVLFRLSITSFLRGSRPARFLVAPLASLVAVSFPVYALFAKYYRLGIPQRERRIQACLGLINDAQNLRVQSGRPYALLPDLVRDGILEGTASEVDGYAFGLALDADGHGFQVTATPLHYGNREVPLLALPYLTRLLPAPTGTRSFWMDQTGNVRAADTRGRLPGSPLEPRNWPWIMRF